MKKYVIKLTIKLKSMISKKCRVCNSKNLKSVLSLGNQPLANNLERYPIKSTTYPLKLNVCLKCFNCQLSHVISSKKLFDNYLYKSSVSKSFKKHFDDGSKKMIKLFKLKKKDYILDVGSNDGIALNPFKKRGFQNIIGIEPAKKLSNLTNRMGIKTYNIYLDSKFAVKNLGKFKIITASNVFAHVNNLSNFTKCVFKILRDDGVFIIEVQYIVKMLKEYSFDNIYHEHVNYWSLNTLKIFLSRFNFVIFNVEEVETHGGSLRVYVKKIKNNNLKINKSVNILLKKENDLKINTLSIYNKLKIKVLSRKKKFLKFLNKIKKDNINIVGYGAPAKASTLINYYKIYKYISYIIDDNPMKHRKYMPGTDLQILNKRKSKKIDYVIIFAWNYFNEIKKKNKSLSKRFINIFQF